MALQVNSVEHLGLVDFKLNKLAGETPSFKDPGPTVKATVR